jgi:hypothetical protein
MIDPPFTKHSHTGNRTLQQNRRQNESEDSEKYHEVEQINAAKWNTREPPALAVVAFVCVVMPSAQPIWR